MGSRDRVTIGKPIVVPAHMLPAVGHNCPGEGFWIELPVETCMWCRPRADAAARLDTAAARDIAAACDPTSKAHPEQRLRWPGRRAADRRAWNIAIAICLLTAAALAVPESMKLPAPSTCPQSAPPQAR